MIQAVIFDWAGTTVDYGCFAPVQAFQEAFAHHGVPVTLEETRKPMGMLKRDHIRTMLRMERIARAWEETHGRPAGEEPHRPRREDAVRADRRNTLNTAGKSRRALFPMRSEGEVPSEAQGGRSGQGKPTTFLFQASPKEETGSTARTEFEAYKNHRTV